MVRKNLKLSKVPQKLVDANYIAGFLGISLNALYLRLHFDNFPAPTKINGKLYFDLNEIIGYISKNGEDEAFCFLISDEIRFLLDVKKLERREIGEYLQAKNPLTVGGAVYSRALGKERAQRLFLMCKEKRFTLDIDKNRTFAEQKKERIAYITGVWENIIRVVDEGKIGFDFLAKALSQKNNKGVGRSIYKLSPSYKSSKIIKLKLLQHGLLEL